MDQSPPTVLFDGVCNLCNGAVNFIIDRDPAQHFRFAALQSGAGRALLSARGRSVPDDRDPDSMILVDGERVHEGSSAALRIAMGMRFPWPLFGVLLLIPRPLRELVYRWVARNRYRWFGREEACRVPTPALRARFLKDPAPAGAP